MRIQDWFIIEFTKFLPDFSSDPNNAFIPNYLASDRSDLKAAIFRKCIFAEQLLRVENVYYLHDSTLLNDSTESAAE